ncbi:hypothetical protein IQ249_15255 [Lusitaniella coriacea LEGE 07157]|uniref:Uncharacterized protein n=1 Tax=Lusitaniella coriacea LEGE 07157 TaxID=945747 RepID=A0A8J7IU34_9CYAN|nr:hypothetical protein [Lusitaniella coriacea]MBE9117257.1 hypothetical protein [Lusitaniella coriacea LEGE 07157]
MITFLRRLASTVGLIGLWAHLYPFILATISVLPYRDGLAFGWISPEFVQSVSFKVAMLLYLTFWFGSYLDAFFSEWALLRFRALQIAVCGCRWLIQSIIRLLLPFLVGLGMYWGLVHHTSVPHGLQRTTAIVFFIILVSFGWSYPGHKIAQIANWKRSQ